MNYILPVASGKGGVGKSIFSSSIGLSLAAHGKTTILVDLDLGGANLHTCLGIKNRNAGVGNLIYKQESHLDSLIIPTEYERLFFIPGDALIPGTANLPYFTKQKILRELHKLVADFIILDLGSGTAYNTVDFFLTSMNGCIVTTPETTAILNAYSFLKTTLYRLVYRSFPPRSQERKTVKNFISQRIERSEVTFAELGEELAKFNPEAAMQVRDLLRKFIPRVVLNMGKGHADLAVGSKLRQVARKNLEVEMEYIGYVPHEESVSLSIFQRRPAYALNRKSQFSRAIDQVTSRLINSPLPQEPFLFEDDEDIQQLSQELEERQ
ncbi:MAG: P-loop NTPase [Spirochaetia bacterium]